jgi:hypothetical protein
MTRSKYEGAPRDVGGVDAGVLDEEEAHGIHGGVYSLSADVFATPSSGSITDGVTGRQRRSSPNPGAVALTGATMTRRKRL